eukprot:598862-Ditylum_brightwellii.AAC.1
MVGMRRTDDAIKIKGNFSVEKLQAILLIKANCNWLTKELFGKRLIARGTETKMIQGDNFGGIKDTSPVDLGCSRGLFWDTLQQRRCA